MANNMHNSFRFYTFFMTLCSVDIIKVYHKLNSRL